MTKYMQRIISLTAIFILLLGLLAYAELTIKADIDKASLTTDETLAYKLLITSDDKRSPALGIPKFEGFKILSQAHSVTMNFTKSGARYLNVYAFILLPLKAGKIKIEPSKVKIADTELFSESFEIEVRQGKQQDVAPETYRPPAQKGIKADSTQITL